MPLETNTLIKAIEEAWQSNAQNDTVFAIGDDNTLAPIAIPADDESFFSTARNIARNNPDTPYAFAGTWPNGEKKLAVTVAASNVNETVKEIRDMTGGNIATNSFTDDKGGVTFVAHTRPLEAA